MTAPKQAVATERGRYYVDPNPAYDGARYPSVTNVLGTSIAKPALVQAAANEVADYAMATLPTLVRASRDPDASNAALKDLKSRARVVWDAAAERGTHLHDLAEAHLLGLPKPEVPEDVLPLFEHYLQFLTDFDVDLNGAISEASVVNRDVGYAGTLDIVTPLHTDQDPEPVLWLIDVKSSSKHPVTKLWPEHPYQLAALRHAKTIWLPNGLEEPMPYAARCGILNVRPWGYALLPVEAGTREFAAFKAALTNTKHLHAQKLGSARALPAKTKAVA